MNDNIVACNPPCGNAAGRAPVADIRDAAKANGMLELREDGLAKVLEGLTTPDEVMRVVFTAGF